MSIPVVDLRDCDRPETHARFVQTLGGALEQYGFVIVQGHGIDVELGREAYRVARRTFALPEAVKASYETPEAGRQRGYTSFGVEHAKDTETPDLKEFWQIGRDLPADHPFTLSGEVPQNRFPAEMPAFGPTFRQLFVQMEGFANRLLAAVGEYLELPEHFFRDMVQDSNSIIRVIHYPDVGEVPAGAVRAAAHEDINLLTVLPASTRPGLEILTREGEWMPVMTPPDVMICDTGDMMQLLTNGRLPATTHRVVNPEKADKGRLSMPFFLHPHPAYPLAPLDGSKEPITARAFLHRRLEEIGVA